MCGGRPLTTPSERIAVVTAVYGNQETLSPLLERLSGALAGRRWRLRIVIDASPDDSLAVARGLAALDRRVGVTALAANVGQHRALARGLVDEPDADVWVCMDADLQDPPECVPSLVDRLGEGDVAAVFAGRRGSYESAGRLRTGRLFRRLLAGMTGLPSDAGAFVALGPPARNAVVGRRAPSIVAAFGVSRLPSVSLPVERDRRPSGRSAWTGRARLRQALTTLAWTAVTLAQSQARSACHSRTAVLPSAGPTSPRRAP